MCDGMTALDLAMMLKRRRAALSLTQEQLTIMAKGKEMTESEQQSLQANPKFAAMAQDIVSCRGGNVNPLTGGPT